MADKDGATPGTETPDMRSLIEQDIGGDGNEPTSDPNTDPAASTPPAKEPSEEGKTPNPPVDPNADPATAPVVDGGDGTDPNATPEPVKVSYNGRMVTAEELQEIAGNSEEALRTSTQRNQETAETARANKELQDRIAKYEIGEIEIAIAGIERPTSVPMPAAVNALAFEGNETGYQQAIEKYNADYAEYSESHRTFATRQAEYERAVAEKRSEVEGLQTSAREANVSQSVEARQTEVNDLATKHSKAYGVTPAEMQAAWDITQEKIAQGERGSEALILSAVLYDEIYPARKDTQQQIHSQATDEAKKQQEMVANADVAGQQTNPADSTKPKTLRDTVPGSDEDDALLDERLAEDRKAGTNETLHNILTGEFE